MTDRPFHDVPSAHAPQSHWVGKNFPRKEDGRLTAGKGRYLADLHMPGMGHLVFVRSSHAHARLTRVDTKAAAGMPGVLAVITGDQLKDEINGFPLPVVVPALPANYPKFWPLAVGKVRFHGEPVAAVVALDPYQAEDAALAVEIDYDPLPVVLDAEQALKPGAPLLHEDWDDNLMFEMTFTGGQTVEEQNQNDEEVEALFQQADIIIKEKFKVHRCGVSPMETRGTLAIWDDSDGLTAHITTQRPHIDRLALADVLDIPAQQVRVIAPRDQGGGFGVKAPFYREPNLVCHMARKLGRPVRWVETREEHLMAVSQERDQTNYLELAATKDGKMLAVRNRGIGDAGDGCEGVYWGYLMPFLGAALLPNAYDLPKCDIKLKVAVTNKSATSPARSFGAFPTRFAMDRAVDMLAHMLGKDPADVRRQNLVAELPYTACTGVHYDSGDFPMTWDNLIREVDLPTFRKRQKDLRKKGRYIGIGFGVGAELSGVASEVLVPMENQPGYGAATVRIDPRGKVLLFEGDAPQGQGHETSLAQVAAHELGIHPNDVVVTTGDTGVTPFGSGTIGARAGSYTASAVSEACRFLKKKMGRIMAHDLELEAGEDDFDFQDGEIIYAKDNNIRKSFMEMSNRIIMAPLNLPEREEAGLEHTAFFEADKPMITFSSHAAMVEVDIATGQFEFTNYVTSEDTGTVINPLIVEGQVQGGVVQGISNALYEEFVYDENGQQLTTDYENYQVATAADVPPVRVTHAGVPCPHTPMGTRGLGEGLPGPVPAALSNAISDALLPFGIEITELPLRANRIWAAIQAATQQAAE